ncbi:thioesterase domain-containing protein [Micromonospora sp. HUAS LYJ1]|uniref:thioesterase domain-containing protein n=1 Tax=Micromonospora sp. HUAS LYJ1 TaxID=3061626 RepID=UPI0026735E54|nr:thioesterase domain-containing protein [Micromonospora sp. HUAS LYJ1]WKU05541.1 thioesterase domain-containing protein [Micromonospora sp. HUAS LYJ1]
MPHAVLFAGQGTQAKGMGEELFDRFPDEVSRADDLLGYDIVRLCVENPDNRLDDTRYTQPALYVVNALAYLESLRQGEPAGDVLLGHSLGEYNALLAAGAFDFETGLRLVMQRATLMAEQQGGAMLAVVGPTLDQLTALLAEHQLGTVDIANRNTSHQNVLSGPAGDIDRAQAVLTGPGVRVARLQVSAAFHSRYMRPARDEFAAFLKGFRFAPLTRTVIANATARPYADAAVARTLSDQIAGVVSWSDSVRLVLRHVPADDFREVGGAGLLTRMVRQIAADAPPTGGTSPTSATPSTAGVTPVADGPRHYRLFGVAYAGGDQRSYHPLGEHSEHLELCPLERPGRGRRAGEQLLWDVDPVVEDLMAQLRVQLTEPYALYGHSLGARLAFLLCRRIRAEGLPAPRHLIVSGECGPSIPSRESGTWRLHGDAFWQRLDLLGGIPAQLRDHHDLMAYYERILRADLTLLGRYEHREERPLNLPITALTGDREPFTDTEIDAWQRETTYRLTRHRLPGDHFFIRQQWPTVAALIDQAVLGTRSRD